MLHSVTLDKEKCKGCTTCIKQCPTEAIRVRRGKAHILTERCIDCGQCIRVCPHHAKKAVCDPLSDLDNFKYRVALPAPSLYGQFHNLDDINIVLTALLSLGFDDVYEVSRGAEMISDLTRRELAKKGFPKPIISSACPAATRLICMRFPKLVKNIALHIAPAEIAAVHAREEAVKKSGLKPEEIGIFFITPCPAKVTAAHSPLLLKDTVIDGAISIAEIYKRLLPAMKQVKEPLPLAHSGIIGIGWARSGGEASAILNDKQLAVDGIQNIIDILEAVENGFLPDVDFLELNACNQGCVGGCLTVENPYAAKARLKRLMKFLPISRNKLQDDDLERVHGLPDNLLKYAPDSALDEDRSAAMAKFMQIDRLTEELPGLDCGSCGAPSCHALAEDIVLGIASEEDCIFHMRDRMRYMAGNGDADEYLPPPFRTYTGDITEEEPNEEENDGLD